MTAYDVMMTSLVSHLCLEGCVDPVSVSGTDLVHYTVHLETDIPNLVIPRQKGFLFCAKERNIPVQRVASMLYSGASLIGTPWGPKKCPD